MRFWYDTEFIEDGKTIDLISIGIVAEDGREYYAVVEEIAEEEGPLYGRIVRHRWLMENVISHLPLRKDDRTGEPRIVPPTNVYPQNPRFSLDLDNLSVLPRHIIAKQVRSFLTQHGGAVELWGYYSAYDHVVLAQLWGTMMQLPNGVPMWTNDIQQVAASRGLDNSLPAQKGTAHNALDDARWTREAWLYLHETRF